MVLTVYEDRAFLKQALDAGVRGYLLKRSAAENLIQARAPSSPAASMSIRRSPTARSSTVRRGRAATATSR